MRVIIGLAFLGLLVSCNKKQDLGLNLKHLIKTSYDKPTSNCRELGKVSGIAMSNLGFTRSYEQSLRSLLKEAHAKGGNFVFIQRASTDGTNLAGVSYACNNQAKN